MNPEAYQLPLFDKLPLKRNGNKYLWSNKNRGTCKHLSECPWFATASPKNTTNLAAFFEQTPHHNNLHESEESVITTKINMYPAAN